MTKASEILGQILFGGKLQDKLSAYGQDFSQFDWGSSVPLQETPEAPGRNGLVKAKGAQSQRASFPKKSELIHSSARGRLLHYFANHELLAIETMAYALLKFPDAPLSFRQGVFRTLQDEQRHLQQYLGRMQELGVTLGDVPLNLYFWNSLKNMESPLDFVTQMSLTFEQANLDFALNFAELFKTEIADEKTSALLMEVHDDEIKHVAHGLKWFQEWRKPELSDFEAYQRLLPYPLNPRRAKGGYHFSIESRKAAGMSEDFIHSVQVSGGSRGKVPNLYFFNPQCEVEKEFPTLNQTMQAKIEDLAPLMLWLAQEEDVLELGRVPNLEWLREIHALKGELPEIIKRSGPPFGSATALSPELERYSAFEEFKPWGFGESAWRKWDTLKKKVRTPPPFARTLHGDQFFSKGYWKEILGEAFGSESLTFANDHSEILLKLDQSTSGRGHQRLPRGLLQDPEFQKKLALRRARGERFILEPYLPKVHDFSVQYEILPTGKVKEFEPRFFKVDSRFQYQGAIFGRYPADPALTASMRLIDSEKPVWRARHELVIEHLKSKAYTGPVGIDALVYSSSTEGLSIAPIIEVNVRYTMGRVAHEIERAITQCGRSAQGFWVFLNENELVAHGCRNFRELEVKLRNELGDRFIATTPSDARLTWTFVVLDSSLMSRFYIKNA